MRTVGHEDRGAESRLEDRVPKLVRKQDHYSDPDASSAHLKVHHHVGAVDAA